MLNLLKKQYSIHKNTVEGIFWRGLQIFGKQGISFFIFILCAHLLNKNEFGIYNYILSISLFLATFSDFGISSATAKFVAEYDATDKDKLRRVLFNSAIMVFAIFILIFIITLAIGPFYLKERFVYVLYLLPLLILVPLTSLYDGVYRGLKRFKPLAAISIFSGMLSLIVSYIITKKFGIYGALISQNIFYFISLAGLFFWYREISAKWDRGLIKEVSKYSVIIGVGSIGFLLFGKIDTLFLGYFGYIEKIGYLEIVNKLLGLLGTLSLVFAAVIGPKNTQLFVQNRFNELSKKLSKYIWFSFVMALFFSIIFLFFGKYVIYLLFPKYFDQTMFTLITPFSVLLFSYMFAAIIPTGFSIHTGHAKLNTTFLIIFGIIHIILDYILIMIFGFNGIIVSILVTRVPSDFLYIFFYRRLITSVLKTGRTGETTYLVIG